MVWQQGDPVNAMYVLLRGSLSVYCNASREVNGQKVQYSTLSEAALVKQEPIMLWTKVLHLHSMLDAVLTDCRDRCAKAQLQAAQDEMDAEHIEIKTLTVTLLEELRRTFEGSSFGMFHDTERLPKAGLKLWRKFCSLLQAFITKVEVMRAKAFSTLVLERLLQRPICQRAKLKRVRQVLR